MVTHIVFFKLVDGTPERISELSEVLRSMSGRIPQLRHLEVGIDVVRSERSYDVALVTRFDSMEDLVKYQTHPYHAGEVVPFVKSVVSSTVTVDYK